METYEINNFFRLLRLGIGTEVYSNFPDLTEEEWQRLAAEIPKCLSYFIEKNRIAPEEYLRGKGQDYRNTPFLQVYGHNGELCKSCGTELVRTVIGGRSSVYCPACQK